MIQIRPTPLPHDRDPRAVSRDPNHRAFDAAPDRTRLAWTSEIEPHGFAKIAAPFLRPLSWRNTQAIWDSLKRTLEPPTEPTSGR